MRKRIVAVVTVLLAVLSLPATADEEISFEQLFNYFPDTTYEKFGFFNLEAARKTPVFPMFLKLGSQGDGLLVNDMPPLPENFMEKAEYLVSAKIESVESRKMMAQLDQQAKDIQKALKEHEKPTKETEQKLKNIKENWRKIHRTGAIWCVYIPGVQMELDQAIKSGYLVATGKRYLNRPVYDIQVRGKNEVSGESVSGYAYLTADGELLVASDENSIKEMLDCGMGKQRSLIDNQDYFAALQKVDRSHQGWNVEPIRASALRRIEIMTQAGENEIAIQKIEETANKGKVTEISSVLLTEEMTIRQMTEYHTEDEAVTAHNEMVGTMDTVKSSMKSARKEVNKESAKLSQKEQRMARTAMGFAGNLLNNNKITRDGNVVTTDILFSKKQLNTLGMLLSFAESMEKKEKEDAEVEIEVK